VQHVEGAALRVRELGELVGLVDGHRDEGAGDGALLAQAERVGELSARRPGQREEVLRVELARLGDVGDDGVEEVLAAELHPGPGARFRRPDELLGLLRGPHRCDELRDEPLVRERVLADTADEGRELGVAVAAGMTTRSFQPLAGAALSLAGACSR
jgi:hypothetical protein